MKYLKEISFTIKDEITGPFNLTTTIKSGQTAEPEWFSLGRCYWEVVKIDEEYVKIILESSGEFNDPIIFVHLIAAHRRNLSSEIEEEVREYLINLFNLKYDLKSFYSELRNDLVSKVFSEAIGLRLMKAADPFKSLICSILSQNTSVKRWNRAVRNISILLSKPILFKDGSIYYPFPDSASIASASKQQLMECKLGYRTNYVADLSRKVGLGEINITNFKEIGYDRARLKLLTLSGIGPKVADCFLLYGLGFEEAVPVDIWIQRVVTNMYFDNSKISKEKVEKMLKERYGRYAGLVHLYLYHYGRILKNKEQLYL